MQPDKKIVMQDSDEAASIQTVTGWASRTGNFWGKDEHMARFDGSTHRLCDCGAIVEQRSYCRRCSERNESEKFLAMPLAEWDGEVPLNLHGTDTYFFDEDSLLDHCSEEECQPKDIPLVICTPVHAQQIDANEHYCDSLPEDGEVPPELEEAFQALNAAIRNCKTPLCWMPGKTRPTPESLPNMATENA